MKPLDWVVITFCDLNYRGRIAKVITTATDTTYSVEYVDDRAEIRNGEFREDELKKAP